MPTKQRIEKVKKVLSRRQPDLRVVLEEVLNTHNASAVVRTCDAAGILYVDIIYQEDDPFPVNEAISTRAEKWLHFTQHSSTRDCLGSLKKQGFQIIGTHLGKNTFSYTNIDYTLPTAVVFGNEAEGISREAQSMADALVSIPMFGMVQSLNLSVSVGIILYEAIKQRQKKGFDRDTRLSKEEIEFFTNKWLKKD